MSLIEIVFEIMIGGWLVLVLLFLWAIERRLAELVAVLAEKVHESNQLAPKATGRIF